MYVIKSGREGQKRKKGWIVDFNVIKWKKREIFHMDAYTSFFPLTHSHLCVFCINYLLCKTTNVPCDSFLFKFISQLPILISLSSTNSNRIFPLMMKSCYQPNQCHVYQGEGGRWFGPYRVLLAAQHNQFEF